MTMPPLMMAPAGEKIVQLSFPGPPPQVSAVSGQAMDKCGAVNLGKRCQVCGEKASGNFFGALVCLPCKVRLVVSYSAVAPSS